MGMVEDSRDMAERGLAGSREMALLDEIERLRAALKSLDEMIFSDSQVIERAGEWRMFIANVLTESE